MSRINPMGIAVLLLIFFFMYAANLLIPLCYGDDYLYSFVWEENQKFFEPLPESARRLESWKDCFDSLWAHYFSHSGRVIIFIPVFFFLWQGTEYFDFFNAIIAVFLVMELYWISNKGKVSLNFKPIRLCWIFFVLWTFHISFVSVFLWLTGACNYLWSAVLWIGFLIPYIRKWYDNENMRKSENQSIWIGLIMFLFGILAGWTNENTGCNIILLLILMFIKEKNFGYTVCKWEIAGLIGFVIGYILLLSAPGNFARIAEDLSHGSYSSDWIQNLYHNGVVWLVGIAFQFPLWIALWKILNRAKKNTNHSEIRREILCINGFFLISFCTNFVMILLPEFPSRSTFQSLLLLTISLFMAIRMSDSNAWYPWSGIWKKFFSFIAVIYFVITGIFSFYEWESVYAYDRKVKEIVCRELLQPTDEILKIEEFPFSFRVYVLSGFHAVKFELPNNPEDWKNIAYARYYGIMGIRVKGEK